MGACASPPLPYHEVHPGDGPHLLMVHGMLSSRAHWTPNLLRLRRVCTPVVVELYGHGRSPAPPRREHYRPEAYARAFERIRAQLGIERWAVVGQSLGAALTLRYALDFPQRVSANLMTNSMSAFADDDWAAGMRGQMARLEAAVDKRGRSAIERLAVHPKNALTLPPALKAALVADAELHDPRAVALAGAETATHPVLARLGDNRVPSLLLHGTRERRFATARKRAEAQMAQLSVVELGAGHAVNIDAPEAFNVACSEFLAAHTR